MPQGPPKLIINPVNSKVPLNVRQAMLTGLYNAFKDLYHRFHDSRPDIAHKDALLQEEEIHAKTNKTTYRNAIISSIAGLKKRPVPESPEDPSVGSDGTRAQRKLAANFAKQTFVLKKDDIEDLLLNETTMRLYGMPMEVPPTPGGERPHECGAEIKCDRCGQIYIVTEDSTSIACHFHWGRPVRSKTGGTKVQIFTCCSAPYPSSPGCQTGAHVFMEKDIEGLHRRHPFSHSSKTTLASQLDIATIDCEGFYTTQGMSVARVSVCDGDGKVVFDELVRPDEGFPYPHPHFIDLVYRFSGVTSIEGATFDLKGVRQALDALIGPETIIIGHAVENDLMMLRMIHPLIIDTIVLYPSPLGLPYKRSLRVLAQEFLGRSIQTGGETAGHSSAEDALATLDLVKYHVQNRKGKEKQK
ncbi:ribonuclease H-like protein [Serendipita vermifera]|nr:ribonuclease H-like protein [Serendipita vermifera]